MSISAKGSRRIVVGEIAYRWKIARHQRGGLPFVDLLISQEGTKGATLMQPFQTWLSPYLSPQVGPGQARAAILAGLKLGWKPTKPGPQVVLQQQGLTYDSVPVVSPQKGLAHTLLYVASEMQQFQVAETVGTHYRLDFADGLHGVIHPQFLCDFGVSGPAYLAMQSEMQNRLQNWLSRQAAMWAQPDRESWLKELGGLCWGPPLPGRTMPEDFCLQTITKKEWVGELNALWEGNGQLSQDEFVQRSWKIADLLWDSFPEVWQVGSKGIIAPKRQVLPASLFLVNPEKRYFGSLIFHQEII